jgi:hypothetical protein
MFFQRSFPRQPELCMWCHTLYLVMTCCPRNNESEMVNVAKANHGCRKVQYKHGLVLICMMYTIMQLFILKLWLYHCSGFQDPCRVIMCNSHTTQQVKFDRNASAREVHGNVCDFLVWFFSFNFRHKFKSLITMTSGLIDRNKNIMLSI